jgi:hypothetical protein
MATNKTGNRIQSVIQNSLMISHDKAAQISQRICLSNHQSASNGRSYSAKGCLSWKFLHALLDRAACQIVSSQRRCWARFHRAGRHALSRLSRSPRPVLIARYCLRPLSRTEPQNSSQALWRRIPAFRYHYHRSTAARAALCRSNHWRWQPVARGWRHDHQPPHYRNTLQIGFVTAENDGTAIISLYSGDIQRV